MCSQCNFQYNIYGIASQRSIILHYFIIYSKKLHKLSQKKTIFILPTTFVSSEHLSYATLPKNYLRYPKTTSNNCFHNPQQLWFQQYFQRIISWDHLCQVPDLGVRGGWTSPRRSWTSRNNFKYLFSSFLTTFVSTTLPKRHSLGLPWPCSRHRKILINDQFFFENLTENILLHY